MAAGHAAEAAAVVASVAAAGVDGPAAVAGSAIAIAAERAREAADGAAIAGNSETSNKSGAGILCRFFIPDPSLLHRSRTNVARRPRCLHDERTGGRASRPMFI